jgi:NADH dehydrogenase FAD-containing subunit
MQGEYYEASCQSIDPAAKELTAAFPNSSNGSAPKTFKIKYDLLVVGVSDAAAAAAVSDFCVAGNATICDM